MRVWGLKTCDTTRKALAALREAGHEVTFVDVRESGIDAALAAQIVALSGDRAVNRASATWRGLGAEERDAAPETLLQRHPLLMKRPVIRSGDDWTQGWDDTARRRWL
ncbi:MAG: arsenate reductase [Rubellimicrobium sp.]|nr:arsenate reductase [Rubellimicrobium sp.]